MTITDSYDIVISDVIRMLSDLQMVLVTLMDLRTRYYADRLAGLVQAHIAGQSKEERIGNIVEDKK